MFNLIWEDEIIDTASSADEAAYLANEYRIAYGGVVTVEEVEEETV
jgi:hypothetical protein